MHVDTLPPSLTERQREVLERVASRATLKEVAAQLGLSESSVNQHVRELKRKLGVGSLSELARVWRSIAEIDASDPCRNSAYRISHLHNDPDPAPLPVQGSQSEPGDAAGKGYVPDTLSLDRHSPGEPIVVPGVLDGKHAGWVRLAAMAVIVLSFFATILVGLGAAQGLTALTSDRAGPHSN